MKMSYSEMRTNAKIFYNDLIELLDMIEDEADHSIPSWEEVEEILNMESERGIK